MYVLLYLLQGQGCQFFPQQTWEKVQLTFSMWNSVTTENDVHYQPPCDERSMRRISGVDLMRIIHNYLKII